MGGSWWVIVEMILPYYSFQEVNMTPFHPIRSQEHVDTCSESVGQDPTSPILSLCVCFGTKNISLALQLLLLLSPRSWWEPHIFSQNSLWPLNHTTGLVYAWKVKPRTSVVCGESAFCGIKSSRSVVWGDSVGQLGPLVSSCAHNTSTRKIVRSSLPHLSIFWLLILTSTHMHGTFTLCTGLWLTSWPPLQQQRRPLKI